MQKRIPPILLLLSLAFGAAAQDICIQVIGAAGNSVVKSSRQYDYTVGEAVIATFQNGNQTLTQGFHQPEICETTGTGDSFATVFPGLSLRPNPTADKLLLTFEAPAGIAYKAQIFNMTGQPVSPLRVFDDWQDEQFECRLFPPGLYLLLLRSADGARTAMLPFVKVN